MRCKVLVLGASPVAGFVGPWVDTEGREFTLNVDIEGVEVEHGDRRIRALFKDGVEAHAKPITLVMNLD